MTHRVHPTVTRRFAALLKQIAPNKSEVARARRQVGAIRARLQKDFRGARVFPIGSHVKQTAIWFHSDVDVLAHLPPEAGHVGQRLISSTTLLDKVRTSLQGRFWSSELRRDGQAIVLRFGAGRHPVDAVPALSASGGGRRFLIPDGYGDWLVSAPMAHAARFRKEDRESRGALSKLTRLVKWWSRTTKTATPIESFFIENALLNSGYFNASAPPQQSLLVAFGVLAVAVNRDVPDPTGVSLPIRAADTTPKLQAVARRLNHALDHATRAVEAENRGKWREAVRQWRIVFNGEFPLEPRGREPAARDAWPDTRSGGRSGQTGHSLGQ